MRFPDARNLPVTAAGAAAVERLDLAVTAYLGARADARGLLDAALRQDPGCPMAHCLDGYLAMMGATRETTQAARSACARGDRAARSTPIAEREGLHLAALGAWCRGDWRGAAAQWELLLRDHPLDILAIRVSQFVLSYLGESQAMLESVSAVRPHWDEGVPGFGFLAGCEAYALEETGQYRRAEAAGRMAVELNPEDIWAAHAVAHVREMEGRLDEGIQWIEGLTDRWHGCGNFAAHLRWHEGLFRLDREDPVGVLAVYDRDVRPPAADEYLDIVNGVSLLWRLEQAGVDVGPRWEELARRARGHLEDHVLVFADVHYLMALAALGDGGESERFLESSEGFAAGDGGTEAMVMGEVGMALLRSVMAHRRAGYDEVVDRMYPVRHLVRKIGGSHAQRDLFEQLLIDSACRAQRFDLAAGLLAERVTARPQNRWGWAHYAMALDRLGLPGRGHARRRLEELRAV